MNAASRHAFLALGLGIVLTGCVVDAPETAGLDLYRDRLLAIEDHDFFQTTRIVDRNGVLLAEIAPQGRRTWVSLAAVPQMLRQAVIDTEDHTFYSNSGVDTSAVARAALQNAQAGETVSGASTITMQLVRMVAFEGEERTEATLERKLREAHLAAELDERHSKDEILEAYLNIAYFGQRAYGVESAANTYFARSVSALTPGQATLVAGLLQAPSLLDPIDHFDAARARQRVVLDRMIDVGTLTPEAAEAIWQEPFEVAAPAADGGRRAPHFVDYVLEQLPTAIGPEAAARGGFVVTTTLDVVLNERSGAIARAHVDALKAEHDLTDAALVAIVPSSGEILAMVGGVDYDAPGHGQVNVTVAARQSGSAFKPITYAAALERGWTPASILWDVPLSFPLGDGSAYRPVNYDGRYRGPIRLREALASSLNAASVGLLAELGVPEVHALAVRMGLPLDPNPWQYGLSLTLGGAEVPLLDLTSAYATLAAGGRHIAPTAILAVTSAEGEALYEDRRQPEQAVSAEAAYLISDILSDAEARRGGFGAGTPLETSQTTAVKTGTTNDFRDNITVGYTPYLTVGVWAGNKDGHPMRNVLGITGAAPVWHDAMEAVFLDEALLRMLGGGGLPPMAFEPPGGIARAAVCRLSTLTVDGRCQETDEVFAAATALGDFGTVIDWYAPQGRSGAGGPQCAERVGPDGLGRRIFLVPPRDVDLAAQVRQWASVNGVAVAPPSCGGAGAALPGTSDAAAAAQAPSNPGPVLP